jgi:LDH2 family malate/lactate/ureidoglycolate dehydrogenase
MHIPVPTGGSLGGQSGFMWLIRPAAFAPDDAFGQVMRAWTDHYLASGGEGARLPGGSGAAREVDCRARGVPIEGELLGALRRLGEKTGVAFPQAVQGASA